MKITLEKIGDVTVAVLRAEYLDASNTQAFKGEMEAAVAPNAKVVLDLSQVLFVDSVGCGGILSCLRKLNTVGGELKLCAITKPVRMLFELIRLHLILDIFNTREEAIRASRI
jgi:anti-sigma B factor antagonist